MAWRRVPILLYEENDKPEWAKHKPIIPLHSRSLLRTHPLSALGICHYAKAYGQAYILSFLFSLFLFSLSPVPLSLSHIAHGHYAKVYG